MKSHLVAEIYDMGCRLVEPEDVTVIFSKAGSLWTLGTDGEIHRVTEWLNQRPQNRYFLVLALRVLGDRAKYQDAEDAWQKFFTPRGKQFKSPFDRTVETFDPNVTPFLDYLTHSFVLQCLESRGKLQRQCAHERSTYRRDDQGDGIDLEIEDHHPDSDPAVSSAQKQELAPRQAPIIAVRECMSQLDALPCLVLLEHYFEGKEFRQIAEEQGITLANTKVIAYRARNTLRSCLEKRLPEYTS